jgi:hypothetical protein
LIEEQDEKKLDATNVNPSSSTALLVLLKLIHTQVVHWWAALPCHTPLSSR